MSIFLTESNNNINFSDLKLEPFNVQFYNSLPEDKNSINVKETSNLFILLYKNKKIGITGCFIPENHPGHGHFQIYLIKEFRGKKLLPIVSKLVFQKLKLNSMSSSIRKDNIASIKSHENSKVFKKINKEKELYLRKNSFLEKNYIRYEYIN